MSLDNLVVKSGLYLRTISLLERGTSNPRPNHVVKLAEALRIDPSALFDGIPDVRWGIRLGADG
jgi:transcriptional regulator with XRE-family HTH domain